MDTTTAFDQNALEYDNWFEKHRILYQSEILALKQAVPTTGKGIEIGVGTGRFAEPFNIREGLEPSANMASIAENRGIKVTQGYAENIPFENNAFDFALIVTTVCFLEDLPKAFSEIYRILKPRGVIILGIIDKDSFLGKQYQKQQAYDKFYAYAHFHATGEITTYLEQTGFQNFSYWQTLTSPDVTATEQPTKGFGKGSFVVIKADKP